MLKLLQELFSAIQSLFSYFSQKQLIEAGETKVIAKQASKETEIVIKANEARDSARAAAATIPSTDSLPDDGFRRD